MLQYSVGIGLSAVLERISGLNIETSLPVIKHPEEALTGVFREVTSIFGKKS